MLGAIIGDLAAWTYEHDRACFWSHLVSDEAKVSEFGLSVLTTAALIDTDRNMLKEDAAIFTQQRFRGFSQGAVELSSEALDWSVKFSTPYGSKMFGIGILRMAACAFFDAPINEMWFEPTWDKEEGYARLFLSQMMTLLRKGKTKDDVYEELGPVFKGCRHDWNWQEEEGMFSYLLRSWDAFYRAFDFTSSIHNAMKMKGDHHLMGTFTGAIAGAMYGCRYNLIKEKYRESNSSPFEYMIWPKALMEQYATSMLLLEDECVHNRVFYPKNNAMTNVEVHEWHTMESTFSEKVIDEDSKQRLLYSFEPDWDNRYGIYFDNGWFYVYRSGVLLTRFQLRQKHNKTYSICHLQFADNEEYAHIAMSEALRSSNCR